MAGVPYKVVWDQGKIAFISQALPEEAHMVALVAAAQAAAGAIHSRETGRLAAQVRVPRPMGRLSGLVGSDLPYARIQDQGGTITAKGDGYLYIHGQRNPEGGSTPRGSPVRREAFPATGLYSSVEITAKVKSVQIDAKNYLAVAPPVYGEVLMTQLKALFPK